MTHVLACALYCNSDGTLNGLGTVVAWMLGIPFGLAFVVFVIRVLTGTTGRSGRRRW